MLLVMLVMLLFLCVSQCTGACGCCRGRLGFGGDGDRAELRELVGRDGARALAAVRSRASPAHRPPALRVPQARRTAVRATPALLLPLHPLLLLLLLLLM